MKRILEILFLCSLAIFFFVSGSKEVFASSYMFTTINLPGGGATGSQNPGFVSTSNTTYTHLIFGYTNLDDGIFDPGEKWRITADYCTKNEDFISYYKYSEVGMTLQNFDWHYGGQCFGTDKNGNVSVGVFVSYTVDFTIDDSPAGTLNLVLNKNGNSGTWFQFRSYRIIPPSELSILDGMNSITGSIIGSLDKNNQEIIDNAIDNKNEIINNQDKNTSDIINNFTQNIQNQIDNSNKNQAETNEKLDGINNSITDESPPNIDNAFGDIKLDKDSAISDLILLPIKYLQRVLNLSSKSCKSYSLDFGIFGSSYILNFPCIKLDSFFGPQLWSTIDYLICFFMIYEIIMLFIKAFEDLTSLRDTYDSLYQPKHAEGEYQPRHGGGN